MEFNDSFPTRYTSIEADPLWTRIESDPIKTPYNGAGVSIFNSVRQITLNFNSDNTTVKGNGNQKYYEYRPYVIFYDGPENIDYTTDKNDVLIRHSQPVVVNLNANTNAILYMPESPVIINGNDKALHGFVIAKCFLQSVTEEEMIGFNSITLYDGFNKPSKFSTGYSKGTDGKGQAIYFHDGDLVTKEQLETTYANATITVDGTTENIVVKELIPAPKYPIIDFTKDLYTDCTTVAEYFAKTAEYITANYTKAKYAQFAGISESQVSMIKFPDEKETLINASGEISHNYGNFTAIEIPVATADLLDSDPDPNALTKDNKYVKVMLGTEEKYILKSKLPYTRVKWNANYPYVCLYDLKTGLGWGLENPLLCVKPMDGSTTDADSAIVFTNSTNKNVAGSNQWGDVWVVERRIFEDIYNNQYKTNKLEFGEKGDMRYFMLKSEIPTEPEVVAKYHKVTLENGDVKYLRDDDDDIKYYTKVQNNANNPDNYIIVDKNGNIITKAITAPEVLEDNVRTVSTNESMISKVESIFSRASDAMLIDYWKKYTRDPKDPDEIPGDRGGTNDDGQYVGLSEYRKDEDYRIPALERVYKMSTFNLNSDSYYTYFQIGDLWRVNYTYLNVDELYKTVNRKSSEETGDEWKVEDMFFTTTRAEWID